MFQDKFQVLLTFLAEVSSEAFHADAPALLAVAVSGTVGHLALVVPQAAFFALPAGLTVALAVDVVAVAAAQQRAGSCWFIKS